MAARNSPGSGITETINGRPKAKAIIRIAYVVTDNLRDRVRTYDF
ncbi:hypothetical protein FHS14_004447 [Paenibacillus baekrokdamisoli]|nr:hypothetical protein [Paenibacillus baekrokdamisoli]MBB3071438.1 hypothetical protein [Paenibacillus baekrokdamisoli]